jgi:Flagellin and related hook-associated proteins
MEIYRSIVWSDMLRSAKSTENLSSGFKINRAADDAAELTISEKMRKQTRGLDRASTNIDRVSKQRSAGRHLFIPDNRGCCKSR